MDLRRLADGFRETDALTSRAVGCGHMRLGAALLALAAAISPSCASEDGAPLESRIAAVSATDAAGPPNLDLLFVIDNGPGMAPMQAKLVDQIPSMFNVLNGMPAGSPSVHVAVISTDMGAYGDRPETTGCSESGDQGAFQVQPRGTCDTSTLLGHTTFLSTGGGHFDDASLADLTGVVQCMLPLGEGGCQYVHPLAAIARALGADGIPAPASNAGFLRPDAMLAIIILSNQDDCSATSAPALTPLFSVNGGPDTLTNAYGPLTTYRCNEFGHLCVNPHSNNIAQQPPESPTQGEGTPPTLNLANCTSNEQGLLTPVGTVFNEIRALKPDGERQIVVGLIAAPVSPYTVTWVPASDPTAPAGQLWPEVEHACGPANDQGTNPNATDLATDGSFGDPSVRLTQFAGMFGRNGMTGSVCYPNYGTTLAPLTALIAAKLSEFPYLTDTGVDAGSNPFLDGSAPASDGGVVSPSGAAGSGPSGSAGSSGGGGHGGVTFNGKPAGLQSGCVCSVGTAATPGGGVVFLLICAVILRRRSGRGEKS